MQFFFHGRIAQAPPQLQAVDAQHGLDGEWRAATQILVRTSGKGSDEGYQRCPGNDLVHLIEEDILAGLLGQRIQAQGVLTHGAIVLDAWRCERSAWEVLQTFPSGDNLLIH